MTAIHIMFGAAALLTGLSAGLFYAYDCSVINGLGDLPDREYILAFQSINKAIQNPYFFLSFMGALIALLVASLLAYNGSSPVAFYFLLAAAIIYAAGVFGITVFGNVPLNNRLDQVDVASSTIETLRYMRQQFEARWNLLHHLRTYAAILSFILCIIGILKK